MTPKPPAPSETLPLDADEELDVYDNDFIVQQLSDIGQRLEIMLEAAGGPFEQTPETPTDLPTDLVYQRELTLLTDRVAGVSKLRRLVLRDEDEAFAAEEDADDADATDERDPNPGAPRSSATPPRGGKKRS